MEVKRVYVQADRGVPASGPFYRAWEGFRKRGVPCELFDPQTLENGSLPLERETLVAGAVRVVERALGTLGIVVPPADNLPRCLAKYRGREIGTSTWGELRQELLTAGIDEPRFIKPLNRNKRFPAFILYDASDVDLAPEIDEREQVLVSQVVEFVSEWRCFVLRGEIVDLCRYDGNVFDYTDPSIEQQAVVDYGAIAPEGYGIDFGVLDDGRTVLVEVNEGYSLNPYGLEAMAYSEILEARWLQLVNTTP